MKRTIALLAALVALTSAYFGSQLAAQGQGTGSAAPSMTKVGVVNIGTVFMKYQKAMTFKAETEQILKPYRDEGEKLKKLAMQWEEALRGNKLTDEQKKQGERTIIDVKRRLEDLDREARTKVGKRNEEQIVQLYKEINDAVQRYAQGNGFHLILGYGEPPMETDLYSFMNVSRKMQAMDGGALIPMHWAPGLDISAEVVANLNRGYGGTATPVSTGTGGNGK